LNWQADHYKHELNHWWFQSRRKVLDIFLDKMIIDSKKSIIELGCGTGGNLKYLFKDFNEITGVELDTYSYKTAKLSCPNSEILKLDINDLSSIKKKYQLVSILDVLYHESIKNPSLIIDQANKLNVNSGYILICEPAFKFLRGKHSKYVNEKRRFKKVELEKIVIESNYRIVFSSYWGMTIFPILYVKRRIIERYFLKEKTENKSDFTNNSLLNWFFYYVMFLENRLINYLRLPFGSSILILAKKIN